MIDEHGNEIPSRGRFSAFWPLAILSAGFLIWTSCQCYQSYSEQATLNVDVDKAMTSVTAAQNMKSRLAAVAEDLLQTSAKDPYAAQIVKEFHIQVRPRPGADAGSTNSTSAPAAPAAP